MIVQGVSIGEMMNQSKLVLTKPSVATFEQFEKHGGQREALTYVGVAAAISAIIGLVLGLAVTAIVGGSFLGAVISAIINFIQVMVAFFVSAWLIYTVGRSQGGTGTQEEVFYTFSLFVAPILAISSALAIIPCLGALAALALLIYQIYLGYLAVRSSMNLDQNKAIITMVVVFVVQLLIAGVFSGIALALGAGAAAVGA
ncbi:MAG TPA: Yip1 family protein [Roseiflexaceae bacterium]|nr:Yip1 family protein [Roseiflexaceae bacterium]